MADTRASGRTFVVTIASAMLLKLWLTSQTRIIALYAPHDNSNFLEHAKNIAMGLWFGPYDEATLIKQPFFPLYMAGLQEFGIPLPIAHQLFYGLACFVACFAIKPLVRSPFFLSAAFVILYFNPMENDAGSWTTARGQINSTLALLTISCAIGLYIRRQAALRITLRWAVALGISFSAFWLTREEAVWMLPALAVLFVFFMYPVVRPAQWLGVRARLVPIGISVVLWLAAVGSIMFINGTMYGWYTTAENMSPEFVSAYDSLARIDPGVATDPRFPVPHAARMIAYRVSPAARELASYLDGPSGVVWQGYGCQFYHACGDIHGGWFIWAFRDSISVAGYYSSGAKARSFYVRLANEIDTACDSGKIHCWSKGHTLSPPLKLANVPALGSNTVDAFRIAATFEQFIILPPYYVGPASLRPDYDFIVRSVDDGFGVEPAAKDDELKRAILVEIAHTYEQLFPFWVVLALIALFARFGALLRHRSHLEHADYVGIAASLLTGIISLATVLALVTTLSFPALNPEYMSPLYPVLLLTVLLITAIEAPGLVRYVTERLPTKG